MPGLDPRILKVVITIGAEILEYGTDFYITAQGTKFGNQNPNECQVRIDNLTRAHRDLILNETSYFLPNRQKDQVILNVFAGRESYGVNLIFSGNVTISEFTQPPDLGITMNAITGLAYMLDNVSVSMPGQTSIKTISETAAKNLNKNLNFLATDKNISNYSMTGTPQKHIEKINDLGKYDVFVDNDTLVVKDQNVPIPGILKELSGKTGMIGVPEITQIGIRVRMLFDPSVSLGGQINLTSELNPSLNGRYVIVNLAFDLATRENPFYYIAECTWLGASPK